MEKALVITIITLLLAASPTMAKENNNNNGASNGGHGRSARFDVSAQKDKDLDEQENETEEENEDEDEPVTASGSANLQPCDPTLQWKNHGAYVSCVANLKLGGKVVSDAARSDVGKKNRNSATPSASPIVSPSPDASGSASPSASPEATESATLSFEDMGGQIMDWISQIQDLLGKIRGLFAHI